MSMRMRMNMIHRKIEVRIPVADKGLVAHAPVDTCGIVRNIELHPMDRARWRQQTSEAIFVLHHAPTVLVKIDEDETDTGLGPGMVAIEAVTCTPFFDRARA